MIRSIACCCGVLLLLLVALPIVEASAGVRGQRTRGYRAPPTRSQRYSYNYSGVGFPGMEGGLTAASQRSTWLKRP